MAQYVCMKCRTILILTPTPTQTLVSFSTLPGDKKTIEVRCPKCGTVNMIEVPRS